MSHTTNCPRCGGLPMNPRMHSVDVDLLVFAGGDVFTFAGERDTDWRLDAELNAPAANGVRTLVCEDCDHAWTVSHERLDETSGVLREDLADIADNRIFDEDAELQVMTTV
jgi:hypothetical protein